MIPISKAQKIIERETGKLGTERVSVAESVGRVLAENIIADLDLPPFDRAQMDGYALIATDTISVPAILCIVGESAAGHGWRGTIKNGEAIRIMTGAPVPAGATAVQKIELTRESDGSVEILETAKNELSIVRRGAEVKRGDVIFRAGEVISSSMISALASFGYAKLKIGKRPRVAIFGTGSEIVDISRKPGRDQIRNSNSVMLEVLCRKFGAETAVVPLVRDEVSELKDAIRKAAARSEIVLMTGGVSVGKYDHTKAALTELGAEIYFDKLRLKPGKPMVFARLGKALIFALPGNPVSAAVTFQLFVRRALLLMQGAAEAGPRMGVAVLANDARAAKERDTYLPARLETNRQGQLVVHQLKWQGSSDLVGYSRSDALIRLQKGSSRSKGETVEIAFL